MLDSKIRVKHNVFGGNWLEIDVSKEIETEIVVFRRINEYKISELLKTSKICDVDIVLFDSENKKW